MKKKEILEKCKSILNKYEIGEYIYWNDFDFMTDVFSKHEEWELKRGLGISDISIIKDTFGGRCFCLHRTDGSNTDISYIKSVYSNTKISDIKKACRSAIRGEIVTFRNNNVIYDDSKCAITYETLTKGNVHIDHYDLTFASMFKLWIAVFGDNITESLDEFNVSNKNIALQIVSGREGISLRNAKYLVYYNIDFSAVSYFQSRDRMTHMNRPVNDIYWVFAKRGIESAIYRAVINKKKLYNKHF